MVNLFTSYYLDKNPKRQAEIDHCLIENLMNPKIDRVYILTSEKLQIKDSLKAQVVVINKRETFNDYFEVINIYTKPEDINIIANSDIYFNNTIELSITLKSNQCFALSRWEETKHYNHPDSQDAWIFKGKIKGIYGDFCLGIPGCDNRIAYEIKNAGYDLSNPSLSIQAFHHHRSQIRNYNRKLHVVPKPYHTIQASQLINKKILHIALGKEQECLEQALKSLGEYHQLDWTALRRLGIPTINQRVMEAVKNIKPDLIFMQLQTEGILTVQTLKAINSVPVINWTGDVRQPTPDWYKKTGKNIELTLFSNEYDVEVLKKEGIKSGFLNIGFDNKKFTPLGKKEKSAEIVFMGNNYSKRFPLSDFRYKMVHHLRKTFGNRFKVYGTGWDFKTESLMGDLEKEAAVYRSCKVAVNLSHFNLERYTSDRMFRIMGSGAFCLTHNYKGLEKDFIDGEEVVAWNEIKDLEVLIDYFLKHEKQRQKIAKNGCDKVHQEHTWNKRVEQLEQLL